MADAPQEEQRKRPRISQPFMVRYRPARKEQTGWLLSPLRDLSSGGARFISEYPFFVGDTFEMQLLLPASKEPLPLKARVAWVKTAHVSMSEIGVTFDPGDTAIQQAIDQAVTYFLGKQRRDQ